MTKTHSKHFIPTGIIMPPLEGTMPINKTAMTFRCEDMLEVTGCSYLAVTMLEVHCFMTTTTTAVVQF